MVFELTVEKLSMKNKLGGWLAAAVVTVSCASPVYVEQSESANLAKYKTYSWVDVRTKENDTEKCNRVS